MIKTTKKKSPTHYRKLCVKIAKDEAKKRDDFTCQKCGKKVEGMNAHGSHVYNEGTYRSMSADSDNILCMCYYCHINWWHKSPIDASEWFKNKFPEIAEILKLRARNNVVVNWELRYQEMKAKYQK